MVAWYVRWGALTLMAAASGGFWLSSSAILYSTNASYLSVSFLDVGQGDAIFIETPDGVQMLIDGGPDGSVIRELAKVMKPWDRTIDIVVATHADKDHVAGLIDVLDRFDVSLIIMTTNNHDTSVASVYRQMVAQEGADIVYAEAGQSWQLGASTTVHVYSPAGDATLWESNASSIVTQIVYGETAFMLTGDAPLATEDFLVREHGERLRSNVLKFGHHGSRTSTSELFVKTVAPQYAVASAGRDNRYGHPHPEPVTNASRAGALVLSTAERGTITFYSNAEEVWVR